MDRGEKRPVRDDLRTWMFFVFSCRLIVALFAIYLSFGVCDLPSSMRMSHVLQKMVLREVTVQDM